MSFNGFPMEEVDIAVDFVSPAMPGRYVSYWRLATPSGHKFGQQVWLLIEVCNLNALYCNPAVCLICTLSILYLNR